MKRKLSGVTLRLLALVLFAGGWLGLGELLRPRPVHAAGADPSSLFIREVLASRNGTGTYTLPNGNPVLSGTVITSSWANNTLGDIATELTDSLSRSGKGAMTAPLRLPNGTQASPAWQFDSDTDTGCWRNSAGVLRCGANNTYALEITDSLVTVPLGLTVTETTTNASGVNGTGNGTGYGVRGFGGTSGGGIYGEAGADGGVGVTATGSHTYPGVVANGGVNSGNGGELTSGGGNGNGVVGLGSGSGHGAYLTGGTTGLGAVMIAGTAATGATRKFAARVTNGDFDMDGVANPNSDVSIKNALTPMGLVKGWAVVATGASPSVAAGANVSSTVSCSSNVITVSWIQDFSTASYAMLVSSNADGNIIRASSGGVGSTLIGATLHDGSTVNLCSTVMAITVVVLGAQ